MTDRARGGVDSDTQRNDRPTVSRERAVNGSEPIVQFSAPVPTLEGMMSVIDKTISMTFVWGLYLKLLAEGSKLRAEGSKLLAEGGKLRAEGSKLRAEGDKLRAEGSKLWAEGVLLVYGNVTIEWKSDTHCIVDGKDEYTGE